MPSTTPEAASSWPSSATTSWPSWAAPPGPRPSTGGRAQRGRAARHRPGATIPSSPAPPRSDPGSVDADEFVQYSLLRPAIPSGDGIGGRQQCPDRRREIRPRRGRRPARLPGPLSEPPVVSNPAPSGPGLRLLRGGLRLPQPRHRPTRSSTHPFADAEPGAACTATPAPADPATTVESTPNPAVDNGQSGGGATAPPARSPPTPRISGGSSAPASRRTAPGTARPTSRPRTLEQLLRRRLGRRSGELEERRGRAATRRRPPRRRDLRRRLAGSTLALLPA